MELLSAFDHNVFLFINSLPHTNALDSLALFLSAVGSGGVIWFFIGLIIFLKEEKKHHGFFFELLTTVAVTWVLVEKILKPWLGRARPSIPLGANIITTIAPDSFSFPSGHAAMSWALAVVLASQEPRFRWVFYTLAAAISFSRVYLGVHFPLDIVVGSLLGYFIGKIIVTNSPLKNKSYARGKRTKRVSR